MLNRNPNSTVATFSGLHPFLRVLYARFGVWHCAGCGGALKLWDAADLATSLPGRNVAIPVLQGVTGNHRTLLRALVDEYGLDALQIDGETHPGIPDLDAASRHTIALRCVSPNDPDASRRLVSHVQDRGATSLLVDGHHRAFAPVCYACGRWFNPLTPVHFKTACADCGGVGCDACG